MGREDFFFLNDKFGRKYVATIYGIILLQCVMSISRKPVTNYTLIPSYPKKNYTLIPSKFFFFKIKNKKPCCSNDCVWHVAYHLGLTFLLLPLKLMKTM